MSTYCNYWNKVSLVKSKIKQSKKIDSIGIGLASPEEIRRWGERRLPNGTLIGKVDKDHTVDYESLKPIEGGLFCERIFGPVEDFYCSCDRKGEKNEKFCPNCEVEFTKSRVRRVRMGYIPLAVPVVHVWYLRGRPSYIANLVGKNRNSIDRLAYGETLCESFIGFSSLKSIDKKESFTKIEDVTLASDVRSSEDVKGMITASVMPSFISLAKANTSVASQGQDVKVMPAVSVKQGLCLTPNPSCFAYPVRSSALIRSSGFAQQSKMVVRSKKKPINLLGGHWGARYAKSLNTSDEPLCIRRGNRRFATKFSFAKGLPIKASYAKQSVGVKAQGSIAKQEDRLLRNVASRVKQTGSVSLMSSQKFPFPPAFSVTSQSTSNSSYASPTGVSIASLKGLASYSLPRYLCAKLRRGYEALHSFGRKASKEEVRSFTPVLQRIASLTSRPCEATPSERKDEMLTLLRHGESFSKEWTPYKNQIFEQKQKYLKFHTLPLFSTFVYKEWSHRFSFLEYFIWSARNNDLVLPFYASQNSRSEKSGANLCESIRKSSLNLIKNKFSLRFSNKSNLSLNAAVYVPSLRSKGHILSFVSQGVASQEQDVTLAFDVRSSEDVKEIALQEQEVTFAKQSFACPKEIFDVNFASLGKKFSFLPRTNGISKTRRNAYLNYSNPLTSYASLTKVSRVRPFWSFTRPIPSPSMESIDYVNKSLVSKKQLEGFAFFRHPISAKQKAWSSFLLRTNIGDVSKAALPSQGGAGSLSKQSTKMDTQQFPRLTELLNFTGGAALRSLLSRFDLVVLSKFLRHELKNVELKVNNLLALKMLTYSQGLLLGKLAKRRSKQIRRLKLLELFQSQKSNPEWMILSVIPVLPPDLRPILRVNDDFVVASDLNRLYQTVLRRNNTIHERLDDPLPCPESGLFRQRSLQKAVDGLLENGKGGGTPLCASKRRPLVSLSHVLKGKKGLFRQHLLGKRVDYSGRSVIVVGPRLQLHECGLPKEMAIELFQPFLLHRLKVKGIATSNTAARRIIQQGDPVIWQILKQLVYEHPVLLNRAPTLHRLGIQAFQPRLVSGRAILLHPLVCNGFNADFDGDQMAVHVPLSFQARAEAWKIMWSKNNFLSPATGQPILVPSQDMVLGCYYLSVSIPRILNANVIPPASDLKDVDLLSFNIKDVSTESIEKNEGFTDPLVRGKKLNCVVKRRVVQNEGGVKQIGFFSLTSASRPLFSEAYKEDMLAEQEETVTSTDCFANILSLRSASLQSKGRDVNVAPPSKINELSYPEGVQKSIDLLSFNIKDVSTESIESVISIPCNKLSQRQSTFLNENKGHYFSNLQDSLLAYFQGRLQTHTPFWVRIDPVSFPPITPLLTNNVQLRTKFSFTKSKFTCGPKPQLYKTLYSRFAYRARLERAFTPGITSTSASVLQPLFGSSREMCKTLFQNKSTNHFQIRVEANETLESPLELRLSVDGNLANILTMFQNHYNYNATWVKQCKEESVKYMRTTAGRVVINKAVFKDF